MELFPLSSFDGYISKTINFKSTEHGDVKLDVVYPEVKRNSSTTVLLHYHGGFLIVGDRYSFLPYWLVHACVSRGWIFVTSDYRLLPETNAQSSVADGLDAYDWVSSRLAEEIDRKFDSIILAGSSAGGYLALTVAAALSHKPNALLLIYGMLDPGYERYTKPGSNISGRPAIATEPVLAQYPKPGDEHGRPHLSNYPISSDVTKDERFQLISALHLDALFPDYLTGIRGLSLSINSQGLETIPERHRNLFPSHSPTLRIFRAQS